MITEMQLQLEIDARTPQGCCRVELLGDVAYVAIASDAETLDGCTVEEIANSATFVCREHGIPCCAGLAGYIKKQIALRATRMQDTSRSGKIRELHTRRFGGESTLYELANAAVEEGIFPQDISRKAALDACRRALSALDEKGLPFAFGFPPRKSTARPTRLETTDED